MKKILFEIILTIILVTQFSNLSHAQLEESYDAHGGLTTFKEFGTLEYDHEMEITEVVKLKDHQLIDLHSRNVLITGDTYKLGFDGQEAWIAPNMAALGLPPRFYSSTPFYFFGVPLLFADPGANIESLGTKELDGKEYNVVKISYNPGIGDTPDDNYVAYLDKETNRLKILHYIVTYPPLMQGKSIEELERHAAVYQQWQEVNGLIVPQKIVFFEWSDDKLGDKIVGSMTFENVSFKKKSPDQASFQKPEGAEIDNSHRAQ